VPQLEKRRGFGRGVDEAQRIAGNSVQDNVPTHIRNGVLLKDVSVAASGSVTVNHKLGRALSGWQLMRPRGAGNVHETSSDARVLKLAESAGVAMTFDLWVF
jgi:hypothetical protein